MSPGYRPIDIDAAWPAAGDEQMKDLTLGPTGTHREEELSEEELSALMGGRTIDLRTPGDLSRYFRDDIIRSAQTRYAA